MNTSRTHRHRISVNGKRAVSPMMGVATAWCLLVAGTTAAGDAMPPAAPEPPAATTAPHKGSAVFAVPRFTVSTGGGRASGGTFAVRATIAPPDADPLHPASGGVFAVTGGLLAGAGATAPPAGDAVFANGFETPAP